MNFIVGADFHLQYKLYNFPELEQDLKDVFVRSIDIAIAKKVDRYVFAGDLYEHNKPTPDVIDLVVRQVERLEAAGIAAVGIAGDHDKPINNTSWSRISHIRPIDTFEDFIGVDYSDVPEKVMETLKNHPHRKTVKWIFLHGQVPELFGWVVEKKSLPILQMDFSEFPVLNGFLLGDIHAPTDQRFILPTRVNPLYVSYCGSLGVVRSDEVDKKIGLLHCGEEAPYITRLEFPLEREFVWIKFLKDVNEIKEEEYYAQLYAGVAKKPVFMVQYDYDTQFNLDKVNFLHKYGLLRPTMVKESNSGRQEQVSIRAELVDQDERTEEVLKALFGDQEEAHELAKKLLASKEDYKMVLDEFKGKCFEPKAETVPCAANP